MKNIDQNIIDGWAKKFANNESDSVDNIEMREEFDAYRNTWDKLKEMQNIEQFDTDKAWDNLYSKIGEEAVQPKSEKVKKVNFTKAFAIAASIAILVGIAGVISFNKHFGQKEFYNSNITAQVVKLPDGTQVYLNTNSKIEYSKSFYSEGVRSVTLSGEAFFDVAKDADHPFIITADHSFVKVLGTSFNVDAKSNNVEVVVKTGKVEVYNKNKSIDHVILLPGDKAVLNNSDNIEKTTNKKDNYLGWLNKKLVFKAMPLSEVINDLENAYHCDLEMGDTSISSLKITSTFDDDSLEDILESIALTFNLNIVKEGKKYTLVSN